MQCIQRKKQIAICCFVLGQEFFLSAEAVPPLIWKQPEKGICAVAQMHETPVELGSGKKFPPRDRGCIPDQFLYLEITYGNAEILAGNIFDLMSFIEYYG